MWQTTSRWWNHVDRGVTMGAAVVFHDIDIAYIPSTWPIILVLQGSLQIGLSSKLEAGIVGSDQCCQINDFVRANDFMK